MLELRAQLLGCKTDLAPLARDIHFQQNARPQTIFLGDAVHIFRERERIDTVKEFEERQRVAHLVFLQTPDEMPAQRRRQQRNFCARLLHFALPKNFLTGIESGPHFFGLVRFRDRNQLNFIRRTAALFGRLR